MDFTLFDAITFFIFIISLTVYFQKPTPQYLKLFPFYFMGVIASGIYGEWLNNNHQYNTGIGNVWSIIEFCFYFFVLREIIVNIKIRRILFVLIILFAGFAFLILLFIQQKVGSNVVNNSVGSLITVIFSIYYFMELFQKKEVQSLSTLPAFWIVSAILFNAVLSYPAYVMGSFMETVDKSNYQKYAIIFNNLGLIFYIVLILTAILYSIGFLCRIRIRKSTL